MGLLDFLKGRRDKQPLSSDAKVIRQLELHGSDVSKPHEIDFCFFVSGETSAGAVAEALAAEGFRTEVSEDRTGQRDLFCVTAVKAIVPALPTMERLTDRFERLAQEHGGKYDGWGTEIVR